MYKPIIRRTLSAAGNVESAVVGAVPTSGVIKIGSARGGGQTGKKVEIKTPVDFAKLKADLYAAVQPAAQTTGRNYLLPVAGGAAALILLLYAVRRRK